MYKLNISFVTKRKKFSQPRLICKTAGNWDNEMDHWSAKERWSYLPCTDNDWLFLKLKNPEIKISCYIPIIKKDTVRNVIEEKLPSPPDKTIFIEF